MVIFHSYVYVKLPEGRLFWWTRGLQEVFRSFQTCWDRWKLVGYTHLGMLYNSNYLWWFWGWFIIVIPTLVVQNVFLHTVVWAAPKASMANPSQRHQPNGARAQHRGTFLGTRLRRQPMDLLTCSDCPRQGADYVRTKWSLTDQNTCCLKRAVWAHAHTAKSMFDTLRFKKS